MSAITKSKWSKDLFQVHWRTVRFTFWKARLGFAKILIGSRKQSNLLPDNFLKLPRTDSEDKEYKADLGRGLGMALYSFCIKFVYYRVNFQILRKKHYVTVLEIIKNKLPCLKLCFDAIYELCLNVPIQLLLTL